MFELNGVHEIFPTLIFTHRLSKERYEPLNERILSYLDARVRDAKLSRDAQLQTTATLHLQPEMKPLVEIIDAAVCGVLEHLTVKHAGHRITGCWANINPKGARHERHCHPNNFLSGVYYVAASEGADTISFDDPRPHWTILAPDVAEQRPEVSNTVVMNVHPGTLIVFPSWLVHFVEPNRSPRSRVSVSFNVMFTSFAETISPTRWTPTLPLPPVP